MYLGFGRPSTDNAQEHSRNPYTFKCDSSPKQVIVRKMLRKRLSRLTIFSEKEVTRRPNRIPFSGCSSTG